MTPKLIAEYTELANKYLDQIPVENTSDFEVVAEALKAITDSNQPHTIPDSLKGRISELKEIVDNPDLYVQYPKDYPEFKNIILMRVAAKINEFKQLTSEEKKKYIANQSKIKTETQQKHTEMAQHQPPAPTSDAHTITEEQMLLEQQGQFQTEGSNTNHTTQSVGTAHWVLISPTIIPESRPATQRSYNLDAQMAASMNFLSSMGPDTGNSPLDILHTSSRTLSNLYSENHEIHSSTSTNHEEDNDMDRVD